MIAFALGLLVSVAQAAPPPPAPTLAPKTLRIAQPSDPVTLDWTLSSSELDLVVIQNIQEGLLEISAGGRLEPALAQEWKVLEEGRIHRFKVRPGLTWSDGAALTAQQFIDAWKRLLAPATAAPYAYLFFQVEGAEEFHLGKLKDFEQVGVHITAPDTIELRLKRPSVSWAWCLALSATYPIRSDLISRDGNLWTKPGNLASIGPFILRSRDSDGTTVLEANPKYWRAHGNVTRLEVVRLDSQALGGAFKQNLADIAFNPPAKTVPPGVTPLWLKPTRTKRLSFNVEQFPLTNVFFRQALARTLDRDRLAKGLGRGYVGARGLAPPAIAGYALSGGLAYSPPEARKLFNSLGVSSSKLSVLVPAFDSNAAENLAAANFLKDSFEKVLDVRVSLEVVDDASRWPVLARSKNFSMILHDWAADYPDPGSFYAVYASGSQHTAQWGHPEYDRVVQAANENADAARRRKLYGEADELLTQKYAVMVPLFYASDLVWVGPRAKNYRPTLPFRVYRMRDVNVTR